ncbi:cupin domain-containing protein [Solirubrobacter sp. CPCC 204708]|uniref:Cupin domain-containing protein n=1 Tax=Solirubrobacter deserti TaxID=2282478 RepID=A0ABT4RGJ4_9ACTN|nr:cupin domain-containing protein [Solirubrobacter deserti]MBE2319602.1 cupin domain-containing protein [Solirubrobacter deserti]MDA0137659.1 cupin domain-containing protein [Solirubrobacter deserti]
MVEVTPGGGEIIGDSADRTVELLAELDAVHATIARFAGGRDGADLHVHREHADMFVVLEGTLTVKTADGDLEVSGPNVVVVPPMVVHGFANTSADDVWYVNLHVPGCGFGDYMRGLRDGVKVPFDQHEPPADGAGVRPASEIAMGDERVTLAPDGTVTVGEWLRIHPRPAA